MRLTHRHVLPALAAFLLASLPLTAPLLAQESDPAELFGDTIDVRVVNLEVVVEHKGERVFGLTADDFVLTVDGEPVPIEFFSEVRGGTAVAAGGESGTASAVPAHAPGQAIGTRYLVFIDDVFTIQPYRNRILNQIREDLPRLGPEDHMAVVAYDGKKVDLLSSWSQSQRELDQVFRGAERRPSSGLRYHSLQRFDDDFRRSSGLRRDPYDLRYGSTGPGQRAYADVQGVIDAATSSLRAFAQPEGRKVMIMLSGGWPPAYSSFGFESRLSYNSFTRGGRDLFSPIIDTANLLGYTLYPVEIRVLENRFADASVSSIGEADYLRRADRDRDHFREGVLLDIAEQTGGKALLDGGANHPLEKVEADTRSYYSLGFTPNWRANDQRHRVELDVPGLRRARVRLRETFTDLSPGTASTLRLESAQLFDLPVPSSGVLTASFGEPEDSGWRKVVVPLHVEVPVGHATWVPVEGGWGMRLELRVAVTDDRGDRADIPVVPVIMKSAEKPPEDSSKTFVTRLEMRERPHRILISLLDPISGEELSTRLDVDFDV